MKGKFYTLAYIPNKLVYVYGTTKTEILFLAFFNEGDGMKAVKHNLPKVSKRDLKPSKIVPTPKVFNMIDKELNTYSK